MKTNLYTNFLLLSLFLIGSHSCVFSQVQETTIRVTSTYDLDLLQDRLTPVSQQTIPLQNPSPFIIDAQLLNNELIIGYQIKSPTDYSSVHIQLDIFMNKERIEARPGYLMGKQGSISPDDKPELILTHLTQELPDVRGELQLVFKVQWIKPLLLAHGVTCDREPLFGFRQKIPYFAGAAIGAGGLIGSAWLKRSAETHFERHQNSNILAERNSEFEKYTDQLNTAKILTYVSIGVLAADALLYLMRRNKHKKRLKIYREFCQKEASQQDQLSVQPFYEFPAAASLQQVGLHLSYQF